MARRTGTTPDSLELLLDTICNTFGGIVFLAVLVCLMNQHTSRQLTDDPTENELRMTEARLTEADQKLNAMQTSWRHQQNVLEVLGQSNGSDAVKRLVQLRAEEQRLADATQTASAEVSAADARLAGTQSLLQQKQREVAEQKSALALSRKQSAERQAARETILLRLPRAHETGKRQVPIILAGERVRLIFQYDPDGDLISKNTAEIRFSVPDEISRADLIAGTGTAMDGSQISAVALRRLLQNFKPENRYIAVAVWPDSYKELKLLKERILSLGFEYNLILIGSEDKVGLGSHTGGQVQ